MTLRTRVSDPRDLILGKTQRHKNASHIVFGGMSRPIIDRSLGPTASSTLRRYAPPATSARGRQDCGYGMSGSPVALAGVGGFAVPPATAGRGGAGSAGSAGKPSMTRTRAPRATSVLSSLMDNRRA